MRKKINERGLTLVEILAALVIVGIFSIIIWRFFFQATELNSREVTQTTLQQEANLIVNVMHQVHTKEEIESISTNSENTQLLIRIKDKNSIIFNESGILYEIKPSMVEVDESGDWPSSFTLYFKLTSSKHEKISFVTRSTFSKLEGNK